MSVGTGNLHTEIKKNVVENLQFIKMHDKIYSADNILWQYYCSTDTFDISDFNTNDVSFENNCKIAASKTLHDLR